MANETDSSGSGREPGRDEGIRGRKQAAHRRRTDFAREERSGQVGGEGHVSQQSNADTDGGAFATDEHGPG